MKADCHCIILMYTELAMLMDELGYEEYFYSDGVCLIEWSTLIQEIIPDNAIEIVIEKDLEKGFDYRKITIGQEAV